MTNQSNFRLNDDFQARLRAVLVAAENGAHTSIPRSGDSGVSVGPLQLDLAKQEALRWQLIDAGVRSGAIKDDADSLVAADRLLQSTNRSVPAGQRAAVQQRATELVDGILATPAGREALQNAERAQLADVERAVQRVCGQAGANAREFCDSLHGQLELAAHVHQYGTGKTPKLEAFMRGEQVTLDGGTGGRSNRTRMEGPLTVEQFRERFRNQTEWAREFAPGNEGRHRNLDRYFRQHNIDDGSRARINPGQRSEAAPNEQEAPTQTADADDKIKNRVLGIEPAPGGGYRPVWGTDEEYEAAKAREVEQAQSQAYASLASEETKEQTTNVASGFAQPVAHRTRWNPDRAAIDTAIATLRAEDLPSWTKTLLGRDVLANGQDADVKGFQRAINAATKPPTFDYRWGLGGRQGRIDVDGDLGPQTRAGLGRAIEKQGEDGFKKLDALDQFGRYVKNVDRGRAKIDQLEDTIGGTLGQAIPDAPERAQETLNKFHEDRGDPFTPLKIDGWVGPKTTEAFGSMLRKTSPEALTTRFARDDFWNDEDRA